MEIECRKSAIHWKTSEMTKAMEEKDAELNQFRNSQLTMLDDMDSLMEVVGQQNLALEIAGCLDPNLRAGFEKATSIAERHEIIQVEAQSARQMVFSPRNTPRQLIA
eukprot:390025_1